MMNNVILFSSILVLTRNISLQVKLLSNIKKNINDKKLFCHIKERSNDRKFIKCSL